MSQIDKPEGTLVLSRGVAKNNEEGSVIYRAILRFHQAEQASNDMFLHIRSGSL